MSVSMSAFVSWCTSKKNQWKIIQKTDNYLVTTVPKLSQFWNNFWIENSEMRNKPLKHLYTSGYLKTIFVGFT